MSSRITRPANPVTVITIIIDNLHQQVSLHLDNAKITELSLAIKLLQSTLHTQLLKLVAEQGVSNEPDNDADESGNDGQQHS